MADAASTSLIVLCGITFMLGLRHGFDADHLAIIDGVARLNAAERPRLSRYSGMLFSLGHGAAVIVAACAVTLLATHWTLPPWLESVGIVTSITFLVGLGLANLAAVRNAQPAEVVRPVGLRSRLMPKVRHPLAVLAVGMLFAFSFDTMSQATLMALAGSRLGGVGSVLIASSFYVTGMVMIDGLNGFWISKLLRGADRHAVAASRAMTFTIGLTSLSIGIVGLGTLTVPAIDSWTESYGLWLSVGVVIWATATFIVAKFVVRTSSARHRESAV